MAIINTSPRTNILLKALLIGILALFLLIPTVMVMGIISDREGRRAAVTTEISSKWGAAQTLVGPILSVPYTQYVTDNQTQKTFAQTSYAYFLPEQLNIEANVTPEKRYRSIFEVVVYQSTIKVSGTFRGLNFQALGIKPELIDLKGAKLNVGISDLGGIDRAAKLAWNNSQTAFNSGVASTDVLQQGIHAPVAIPSLDTTQQQFSFAFELTLKGSDQLFLTPVGKETNAKMRSPWASPSFDGKFLPDDRKVGKDGFMAHWNILHLNRNYPQAWTGTMSGLLESSFGVKFFTPLDNYQQATRSVKYAILFIALTFLIFFFVEILNKRRVHPFQYILVGLALVLFYTLLVSISEYLRFDAAYLISSVATILLITLYTWAIFDVAKLAALVGGTLALLYGFIFVLLQLEDKALLIGSLGLFAVLALIMYYSRKIDWYNLSKEEEA